MSTIVDIKTQLHVTKFGLNPTAAAGETIQDEGGTIVINTIAAKVRIKAGGNAGDTAGGAGAEAIIIYGVDGSWNFASEIIVTKGALVSELSTNSYLYVFIAEITNSGAVINVGDIVIENASTVIYAQITAAYGRTERAVFPVFANYELHLSKFRFEGAKNNALTGEIDLYSYTLEQGIVILHAFTFYGSNHELVEWDKDHKIIPEKSLIWISTKALSAGAIIGASFDGDLYKK